MTVEEIAAECGFGGNVADVCPCCGNDRPSCADVKPDGSKYTHAETCATYAWADDICDDCRKAGLPYGAA